MGALDLAVVAAYLLGTLSVGLWASRKASTSDDYFLGARDLPAWAVMLSIVATETSALTVISVPGIGARGDLSFVQLAGGYLVGRIGVAAWLLPGYFDGRHETAYQRLEARFGVGARRALSMVFLATRFLADGVRIFAGAIPLALITGWDVAASIAAMGAVTLLYTVFGGLKAVVWSDALQLAIYMAAGVGALAIATQMGGGAASVWQAAEQAGKLRVFDFRFDFSVPYTFIGALVGGALLSAASHGADHIIVQRLLATRSLREARLALVGSGVVVILQFLLFLGVGVAIWAAGQAPAGLPGDQVFARFIVQHLPAGLAGLVVAGILAAAMSTISSSINSLASSMTHDLYASWTGRRDKAHLLAMGRGFSLVWGLLLIGAALAFHLLGSSRDTPVVVVALSVASVTYGTLLAVLLLSAGRGRWVARIGPADIVIGSSAAVLLMLGVVFAGQFVGSWPQLVPLAKLAFPWYVPLGVVSTLLLVLGSSFVRRFARP